MDLPAPPVAVAVAPAAVAPAVVAPAADAPPPPTTAKEKRAAAKKKYNQKKQEMANLTKAMAPHVADEMIRRGVNIAPYTVPFPVVAWVAHKGKEGSKEEKKANLRKANDAENAWKHDRNEHICRSAPLEIREIAFTRVPNNHEFAQAMAQLRG